MAFGEKKTTLITRPSSPPTLVVERTVVNLLITVVQWA